MSEVAPLASVAGTPVRMTGPLRRAALSDWRSTLLQAVIVAAIAGLLVWMGRNAYDGLQRRGIATGFGFLNERADFAIAQAFFSFSAGETYLRAFIVGLGNTAVVAAAGIVTATLLGTLVGVGRLSSNPLIAGFCGGYVNLFRSSPALLQIVFLYSAFPLLPSARQAWSLFGIAYISNRGVAIPAPLYPGTFATGLLLLLVGFAAAVIFYRAVDKHRREGLAPPPFRRATFAGLMAGPVAIYALSDIPQWEWVAPKLHGFNFVGGATLSPEFMALYFGLSFYSAAFIAEIVRAGILSIDRGQIEAAQSIALKPSDTFFKVVAPQALRLIVPPLASQYISLIKSSSLGVAIGYPELFSITNTVLNYSGQTIAAILIMAAVYLFISLAIGLAASVVNSFVQIKER